ASVLLQNVLGRLLVLLGLPVLLQVAGLLFLNVGFGIFLLGDKHLVGGGVLVLLQPEFDLILTANDVALIDWLGILDATIVTASIIHTEATAGDADVAFLQFGWLPLLLLVLVVFLPACVAADEHGGGEITDEADRGQLPPDADARHVVSVVVERSARRPTARQGSRCVAALAVATTVF